MLRKTRDYQGNTLWLNGENMVCAIRFKDDTQVCLPVRYTAGEYKHKPMPRSTYYRVMKSLCATNWAYLNQYANEQQFDEDYATEYKRYL